MRNLRIIAIMILVMSVAASTVCAQHHPGKFGMGLIVNGSTPGFILSLSSSHWILEPTFSMEMLNRDARNRRQFMPGMGMLYQFRGQSDVRPFIGARFEVNFLRTTFDIPVFYNQMFMLYESVKEEFIDVFVGPVFGARYFLSDHFAVSGEFQVMAAFYDKGDLPQDHRNLAELAVSTSQLLAAYFYF